MRFEPVTPPPPPVESLDVRLGQLVQINGQLQDGVRIALIGFPTDDGVRINKGRVGAAGGPPALRSSLYRLTPDARSSAMGSLLRDTVDLGDIPCTGDLANDQRQLGAAVAACLDCGAMPVVLGGGHETTFGHFLGFCQSQRPVRLVNFDAHPDVRLLIDGQGHSGSPFRQAVTHESETCTGYSVVGLSPHATAAEHLAWLEDHGGQVVWKDDVAQELPTLFSQMRGDALLVSFDLDAVDGTQAPGVSAPNANGLSLDEWYLAAFLAGQCKTTISMDVVELNPKFDVDGRTARLAALTVWHFLRGMSLRE